MKSVKKILELLNHNNIQFGKERAKIEGPTITAIANGGIDTAHKFPGIGGEQYLPCIIDWSACTGKDDENKAMTFNINSYKGNGCEKVNEIVSTGLSL